MSWRPIDSKNIFGEIVNTLVSEFVDKRLFFRHDKKRLPKKIQS